MQFRLNQRRGRRQVAAIDVIDEHGYSDQQHQARRLSWNHALRAHPDGNVPCADQRVSILVKVARCPRMDGFGHL